MGKKSETGLQGCVVAILAIVLTLMFRTAVIYGAWIVLAWSTPWFPAASLWSSAIAAFVVPLLASALGLWGSK
jgi:hypothetical protein